MPLIPVISPHGSLFVESVADASSPDDQTAHSERIQKAFSESTARGLLHLATVELQTNLDAGFVFARDIGRQYLTRLCHVPENETPAEIAAVPPPPSDELATVALSAPPMQGLECLSAETLAAWWRELDTLVRDEIRAEKVGIQEFLRRRNPLWRTVGRVTFHLAENKRDPEYPFAFLATYASRLSAQGRCSTCRSAKHFRNTRPQKTARPSSRCSNPSSGRRSDPHG